MIMKDDLMRMTYIRKGKALGFSRKIYYNISNIFILVIFEINRYSSNLIFQQTSYISPTNLPKILKLKLNYYILIKSQIQIKSPLQIKSSFILNPKIQIT